MLLISQSARVLADHRMSTGLRCLVCLASTGVKAPRTMLPSLEFRLVWQVGSRDESCECSEAENPVDYFQCQRCVILLHQFGTDSEVDAGTLPAENRFGLGRYPFRVRR